MPGASTPVKPQLAVPLRMLLLLAFVLGVALRLWAANTEEHQSPDTFQYARQAAALQHDGVSSLRAEAAHYLSDPGMAGIPVVSRSLWLATLGGWSKLTDTEGPETVASFACFADILALGVLALLANELLGTGAAIAATLLYAVSPAALYIARHGLGESFTSLLALLTLLLAVRALAQTEQRWPIYALGVLAGLTFAVKETAFVHSALVVAFTVVLLFARRQRSASLALGGVFAIALLAAMAWNAYALGGLSIALRLSGAGRDPHGLIPYAVAYQSGTPVQWVEALFLTDPAVFTLGLAGLAVSVICFRRTLAERPAILFCGAICIVFVVLPMLLPNLYNVRWLSPTYGPACLLAAFALQASWQRIAMKDPGTSRHWRPAAVCVLSVCAGIGAWRYSALIAAPDLQDLSLKMVLTGRN